MIGVNTTDDSREDCCKFSLTKWQRIQALSLRMQAIKSLLDFFNSDDLSDRQLANEFKSITDYLKTDFEETIISLVQLIDLED